MVGRPSVDQSLVARRLTQQNPTGPAVFGPAHCREFGLPSIHTAEITSDRVSERARRLPATTKSVKEQLVQVHRVGRYHLFAFQPIDEKSRCRPPIEACELVAIELRRFTAPP